MSPLDLLTVAVLALVGVRLVTAARIAVRTRGHTLALARGLRPRHFLRTLPALALVLTAAELLLQVPGLSFGWWTAIGGMGNPVTGVTSTTGESRVSLLIPAAFIVLLTIALPLFVEREEEMFRAGAERRSRLENSRRSVVFGLVHAIVGIPIGVALALSIGGFYFTWAYVRTYRRTGSPAAALLESIRSHLAYNLVVVVLIASYLVVTALAL
jgi:hypothetical protein